MTVISQYVRATLNFTLQLFITKLAPTFYSFVFLIYILCPYLIDKILLYSTMHIILNGFVFAKNFVKFYHLVNVVLRLYRYFIWAELLPTFQNGGQLWFKNLSKLMWLIWLETTLTCWINNWKIKWTEWEGAPQLDVSTDLKWFKFIRMPQEEIDKNEDFWV